MSVSMTEERIGYMTEILKELEYASLDDIIKIGEDKREILKYYTAMEYVSMLDYENFVKNNSVRKFNIVGTSITRFVENIRMNMMSDETYMDNFVRIQTKFFSLEMDEMILKICQLWFVVQDGTMRLHEIMDEIICFIGYPTEEIVEEDEEDYYEYDEQ
jgi:hypothetical protein